MPEATRKVVFYHSVICPRCHVSNVLLNRALSKRSDVELTKLEFLTNRDSARKAGIRSIPALAAEGRVLSGVLLTPAAIDRFLNSLGEPA